MPYGGRCRRYRAVCHREQRPNQLPGAQRAIYHRHVRQYGRRGHYAAAVGSEPEFRRLLRIGRCLFFGHGNDSGLRLHRLRYEVEYVLDYVATKLEQIKEVTK